MVLNGPVKINPAWRELLGWLGLYLVADDVEDILEFDRIHHWQIGAAMLAASLLPPPLISGDEP